MIDRKNESQICLKRITDKNSNRTSQRKKKKTILEGLER